ncbi:hypothetical protein DV713_20325 (plasmid) [Parageobacillus thermoglucosidasius]|nr:hypothetical protein DV713_20325 [Parageobacillus thermoglucosidasius]
MAASFVLVFYYYHSVVIKNISKITDGGTALFSQTGLYSHETTRRKAKWKRKKQEGRGNYV